MGAKKKFYDDDTINRIIKLRKEHNPLTEIVGIMDMTLYSVKRILKDNMPDYLNYRLEDLHHLENVKKKEIYNKKLSEIKERAKGEVITPEKACIIVACEPTVRYFMDIVELLPLKEPKDTNIRIFEQENRKTKYIDIEKTKQAIKDIEKIMFKRNIYRKKGVVVASALYLANSISQTKVSSLAKVTEVSMRNLLKNIPELKSTFELKKEENLRDYYIAYNKQKKITKPPPKAPLINPETMEVEDYERFYEKFKKKDNKKVSITLKDSLASKLKEEWFETYPDQKGRSFTSIVKEIMQDYIINDNK